MKEGEEKERRRRGVLKNIALTIVDTTNVCKLGHNSQPTVIALKWPKWPPTSSRSPIIVTIITHINRWATTK